MSLKVWLPLDGDLRNLGTDDKAITLSDGNTFNNDDGKIGAKSLKLTQLQRILSQNSCMSGAKELSYAYWVKVNTPWTTNWLDGIRWTSQNTQDGSFYVSRQEFYTSCTRVGTWFAPDETGINSIYNCVFVPEQWTHLAGTFNYNTGEVRFYINGILQGQKMSLSTENECRGDFSIGDTGVDISMNDVRIYDHCLSTAEVKEIAQGLVLHYKLDGFQGGFGNPNLITDFDTSFLSYADGAITLFTNQMKSGTQEIISNFAGVGKCLHLHSNGGSNRQYRTFSVTAGKTYTVSADYYSTTIQDTAWRGELNGGNYNWTEVNGGAYTTPGIWKRMSYTCSNLTSDATIYFFIYCTNGTDCYVKNIKIEEGPSTTTWGPPGSSTTTIQDNSGYGHNGTITGTIMTQSESPRYNFSLYLDGSSYISTAANTMSWYQMDQGTLACWMKPTASMTGWRGSWGICQDGSYATKGFAITDYSNTFMITYTNGSAYVTVTSGKTLPQNEWHHCAATLDGTTVKMYFDGELVKTVTIDWGTATIPTATRMELGVDFPGSDEKFTGNYSDTRFYVTPLSDNDIRALYSTSMKIDNRKNIHTFELEEQNNDLLAGVMITANYGNITTPYSKYNSDGEMYFDTNRSSAGSTYIPIEPQGHIYIYDITFSSNQGNVFDIGFERYDVNKTSRSNAACVYVRANTSAADHERITGIVDLSTDGVNPCAYIRLRILNGWGGTTDGVTGQATIHNMSLREITTPQYPKIKKNGKLIVDELKEYEKTNFYKNGIVEVNEIIER